MPVQAPAAHLPIQLPTNMSEKAENAPSTEFPATHLEDIDEVWNRSHHGCHFGSEQRGWKISLPFFLHLILSIYHWNKYFQKRNILKCRLVWEGLSVYLRSVFLASTYTVMPKLRATQGVIRLSLLISDIHHHSLLIWYYPTTSRQCLYLLFHGGKLAFSLQECSPSPILTVMELWLYQLSSSTSELLLNSLW